VGLGSKGESFQVNNNLIRLHQSEYALVLVRDILLTMIRHCSNSLRTTVETAKPSCDDAITPLEFTLGHFELQRHYVQRCVDLFLAHTLPLERIIATIHDDGIARSMLVQLQL
jgi:hypothetical protein